MLRIRLSRRGAKKKPFYRIVVADSRDPQHSKYVDLLGHYDPNKEPEAVDIDIEKLAEWTEKGAQISDTVRSLLRRHGTRAS